MALRDWFLDFITRDPRKKEERRQKKKERMVNHLSSILEAERIELSLVKKLITSLSQAQNIEEERVFANQLMSELKKLHNYESLLEKVEHQFIKGTVLEDLKAGLKKNDRIKNAA